MSDQINISESDDKDPEATFVKLRRALRWNLVFTLFLMALLLYLDPPYAVAITAALAIFEFGSYPLLIHVMRRDADRKIAARQADQELTGGAVYPDVGI